MLQLHMPQPHESENREFIGSFVVPEFVEKAKQFVDLNPEDADSIEALIQWAVGHDPFTVIDVYIDKEEGLFIPKVSEGLPEEGV